MSSAKINSRVSTPTMIEDAREAASAFINAVVIIAILLVTRNYFYRSRNKRMSYNKYLRSRIFI